MMMLFKALSPILFLLGLYVGFVFLIKYILNRIMSHK